MLKYMELVLVLNIHITEYSKIHFNSLTIEKYAVYSITVTAHMLRI